MATARDKLNAYVTHQTDADEARFNALLDAFLGEELGGATVETRVAYGRQQRYPGNQEWQTIAADGEVIQYRTRSEAEAGLVSARRTFPDREHRIVTRTTTITQQPIEEEPADRPEQKNGMDPSLILGVNPNAQHRAGHVDIDSGEPTR